MPGEITFKFRVKVYVEVGFWDLIAVSLVLLFTLGLWVIGPPLALDDFYHLSVARVICQFGFTPTWDWWEYAPFGRPHLYPPLLHVFLAFLTSIFHGDLFLAARAVKVLCYPFLAFCFWLSARGFIGKYALCSLVVLLCSTSLFLMGCMIMPATLVLALTCLLFHAFRKRKLWLSTILMAACFWLHLAMPFLTVLALLPQSILEGDVKFYLKMTATSLSTYVPWMIHVLNHFSWLHSTNMPLELYVPVLAWALGFPSLVKEFKCKGETVYGFYLLALTPLLASYGHRFWVYALIPISFYVGVTFKWLNQMGRTRKIGVILLVLLAATSFTWTPTIGKPATLPDGRVLNAGFSLFQPTPLMLIATWPQERRGLLTRDSMEMWMASLWIVGNVPPWQPVCVLGWMSMVEGDMITAFSGRPTTSGMWLEVMKPELALLVHGYVADHGVVYVVNAGLKPPPGLKPALKLNTVTIYVRENAWQSQDGRV
nr:hypothetical protein [Candidatus Freyrarchaeum guaymaensis]